MMSIMVGKYLIIKGNNMNKTTQKIYDRIKSDDHLMNYVQLKRELFPNSRDFTNQVGYVVMELVSTEKDLFNINRSDIEIDKIAQELF